MADLDHESEALQFEVGSQQQSVVALENPCLWHRNRHPIIHRRATLTILSPNNKASLTHILKKKKNSQLS